MRWMGLFEYVYDAADWLFLMLDWPAGGIVYELLILIFFSRSRRKGSENT